MSALPRLHSYMDDGSVHIHHLSAHGEPWSYLTNHHSAEFQLHTSIQHLLLLLTFSPTPTSRTLYRRNVNRPHVSLFHVLDSSPQMASGTAWRRTCGSMQATLQTLCAAHGSAFRGTRVAGPKREPLAVFAAGVRPDGVLAASAGKCVSFAHKIEAPRGRE